jgi:hypothetical protein
VSDGSTVTTFHLRPRTVAYALAGATLSLVGVSVMLNVAKVAGIGVPAWLVDLFRLNAEENLPSFFSGTLFVIASMLSFWVSISIRGAHRSRALGWRFMTAVFLFLSFDELFAVHERLIEPMKAAFSLPGVLRFAWVLVYGVLVLVMGFVFLPLWLSLERRVRWILAIAAIEYLAGAVGFETLSGAVYTGAEGDILYGLLYTVEETLEMAGLVTLIYGLLLILSGSTLRIADATATDSGSVLTEVEA